MRPVTRKCKGSKMEWHCRCWFLSEDLLGIVCPPKPASAKYISACNRVQVAIVEANPPVKTKGDTSLMWCTGTDSAGTPVTVGALKYCMLAWPVCLKSTWSAPNACVPACQRACLPTNLNLT